MFTLIKFFISFTISFLILAFPISGKPVFYYLFQVTAPMTTGIYDGIKTGAKNSFKKGQEVGWSFFTNATPPEKNKKPPKKPIADIEAHNHEVHSEKDNKQLEAFIKKD